MITKQLDGKTWLQLDEDDVYAVLSALAVLHGAMGKWDRVLEPGELDLREHAEQLHDDLAALHRWDVRPLRGCRPSELVN